MNFGQITQGLRADILAQAAGQGMNVTQLLESGVSFADIMLMIVQNQQQSMNMTAMQNGTELPQMSDMQNTDENAQLPLMQNFQNMTEMPKMLNIQNAADMSEVLNIPNNSGMPVTAMPTEQNAQQNVQNVTEMPQVQNVQQNVQNVVEMPQAQDIQQNVHNMVEMPQVQNVKQSVQNVTEMPQVQNVKQSVQNVVEMPQVQNIQQNVQNVVEMPQVQDIQQNVQNVVEMPQVQNIQQNVQNVVEMPQVQNVQQNVQNMVEMPQTLEIQNKAERNEKSEIGQQITNPLYRQIAQTHDIRYAAETGNVQPKRMKTADFSEVSNMKAAENVVPDSQMAQKLAEILDVISPELFKTSENTASYTNSTFMNDLLSVLKTEEEVRDSFDFSDNMLKVDPLQLAGLLDFIGTGNSIPTVSDISGNEVLKSFESVNAVNPMADKLLFNPEEMIKSGEMEIVSYIPADKNSQSATSQHNDQASDGETIDLARTMKDVRANVKAEITEDTAKFSEITASMVNSNPDEIAQKIDISFDRAYAELEMNKAKYGTPDEQMYKGISENLERGRSEFTVKLRPEGLGEILVKLVSDEGGKAVLSLVASSEKTAELLNRDLASLQTSLNQHNVEIENNSVKTAETVMHAETAFDQYNERRQDEAQQQNHFRQLKNKLGSISDRNASFEAETEAVETVSSDSALNIKI